MHILLSFFAAFSITYYAIPKIIELAEIKHLFDKPGNRKVHSHVIPTLGGLGIFIGFVIAVSLGVPGDYSTKMALQYIIAASSVICFVGVKDDLTDISPTKKFIAQFLCAIALAAFTEIFRFNDFQGIFGFGVFEKNSIGSYLLTIFIIVFIINAYNLIDGIDGLAGSLNTFSCIAFGTYFALINEVGFAVLAFSLAASTLAFLIFNFSPAKIFMGDTGALLLGLINSVLFLKFINTANIASIARFNDFKITHPIVVGLAIILVPVADCFRVFAIRILKGRSPFSPDRNHIHHVLLDLGLSHKQIVLALVSFNIITLFLIVVMCKYILVTPMLLILIAGSVLLMFILHLQRNAKQRRQAFLVKLSNDGEEKKTV